ncbi:hypothetical protein [Lentilactobacillus sp. SPB1-3]|uniref:Uncharacterized protein n=1 Tax=Lentilactobacillus terminaliae TaxID=3003483 RepID=A0ACD5DCN4_9LACO|nr:hypothetical protein [Lentilactobacillus sp. SPB1-3]MCZ0978054.1 hypothetical protein [Lentilactobacillus sp. SPB1-3]
MINNFDQRISVLNRRIYQAKQNGDEKQIAGLLQLRNQEIIKHNERELSHVRHLTRVN